MAAPTAPVQSTAGKLYYNSGSYASPTWTLIDNVGEIKRTDEKNETTLNLRISGGNEISIPTTRKGGLEFVMVYDPADTKQAAIKSAYDGDTSIEILDLDGPVATSGSAGRRITMAVSKFNKMSDQPGIYMVEVAMKPTYSTNAPANYTAS